MRLLITGASGFIGTNAVAYFSGCGVDLQNLDLHPPLNPAHHSSWRKIDIMDRKALRDAVCAYAPTHLIHMAARTDCDENTTVERDYAVNTIGTENILAVVQDCASIERVIIVSSQYVCGPGRLPGHDEDFFPHTVYGQSKVLTEQATRKAGLKCVWTLVRPVNIWGPWHSRYAREAWRVIQRGLYLHPTGAPVIRSYGYVGNVVWQMDRILKAPAGQVNGRVFYLGDLPVDIIEWVNAFSLALRNRRVRCVPRPVLRLLGMIGSVLVQVGIRFPITLSRVRSMTQDYRTPMDATMAALGDPPFTLDAGVVETVRWLRSDCKEPGFRPVNE